MTGGQATDRAGSAPEGSEERQEPAGIGFDGRRFREVLGHFPTGVTVVTAMEEGGPVGFTCQSFTSLSLDPPLVALAPAKSSTSWPKIRQAGAFCVNVLAEGQEDVCRAFAVSGGDKFASVAWKPGGNGAPRIEGALAWVECELLRAHDAGDHEIVLGAVQALDTAPGSPLLFYRGGFARLAPG